MMRALLFNIIQNSEMKRTPSVRLVDEVMLASALPGSGLACGSLSLLLSLPSSCPFLLCVLGARRKRTAPASINPGRGKERRRARGREAGDGVEASVKRWREREREGESEAQEQALEC